MLTEIKRGALFTLVAMVLFGGLYHAVLWSIGRVAFPAQAEGTLIRRSDGAVVGSRLIAQRFSRPEYFLPRPSGVDYNAASTGGTNYGPSNPDQLKSVKSRLDVVTARERTTPDRVPSEMLTASGAGLDPDIPPEGAHLQAARVARARGVPVERIEDLIRAHVETPALGFLGRSRVNVLELNMALDETFGGK